MVERLQMAAATIGLVAIAVCVGCQGGDDGSAPDAITDAAVDVLEAQPRLFCSSACGPVDSLDVPDVGLRPTTQCEPSEICGIASHASPASFYCCEPDAGLACMPYDLDGACLN